MIAIEIVAALTAAAVVAGLVSRRRTARLPGRQKSVLSGLAVGLGICAAVLVADIFLYTQGDGPAFGGAAAAVTFGLIGAAACLNFRSTDAAPRFGHFIDALPGVYMRADREGIIREASGSVQEMFGCSAREIVGTPAVTLYPDPDGRETLLSLMRDEGGSLRRESVELRRPDGRLLRVNISAGLIADGSDCDGGTEALIRDVTDRHAFERTSQETEARFRDFAAAASDWMWETDPSHRLTWLSDAFTARATTSPDEILGTVLWDSVARDDHAEARSTELKRLMETCQPVRNFRFSIIGPDGKQLWRRLNARPVHDYSGNFAGYRGVTSDITAAMEAEHRFESLIASIPDMIFVHRNDRIVFANPAMVAAMRAEGPDVFIGLDTLKICHPDARDAVRRRRERQQHGDVMESHNLVHLLRRDGTDFYGETTIANITWEGELAVLVAMRDVTERRALEARVLEGERLYRDLIELLPDAFFVQSGGIVMYANASARTMFGGSPDVALEGLLVERLVSEKAQERVLERRQTILETHGTTLRERMIHRRLDGTEFDSEIVSAALSWNGRPATLALISDISDRVAAAEAIELSESRFRDFAGATSDWFWEVNHDHRVTWLSDTFEERSGGRRREDWLGRRLYETMAANAPDQAPVDELRSLMEQQKSFRNLRYSTRLPDGQVRWRMTSARACFDDDGTFLGYRGAATDITQEVSVERRFRALIESNPDLILVQRDNRILYVNPALPPAFGSETAADFIGRDSITLYHPDIHEAIQERRRKVLNGENMEQNMLQTLVRLDGSTFFGEATATLIDWEGEPAIMVILRDVDARVRAERMVAESEHHYRTLVELMPEGFLIQCDGRFVFANAGAMRMFGATRDDELLGRTSLSFVHEEDRPQVLQMRNIALDSRPGTPRARARHIRIDGSVFESEIAAAAFEWDGRPATINIIADISERVAAETARRESEERFRDFARSTSDWFWETDRDFRFVWFSVTDHPVHQIPTAELVGRTLWEIAGVDPAASPALQRMKDDILARHLSFRDECVEGVRPDGSRYYISLSGTARFDEDGNFLGYRGSSTDRTEQLDMENRLRQSMKMEAIGQLTGGIAHDFNNLLAIISGNLELLAEKTGDDSRSADFIRPALRAAGRGADLTQYLLAFSRQQPLNPRPTDINRLIAGMTDPLRRSLGGHIDIEVVLAAGGWLAQVDPTQTETAILNLALNARDAMKGGGKLTIETANAMLDDGYPERPDDLKPGRYLMISVSDEGTGIAPDLIDRVFDPFVTTKEVGQGSGLGLSMVYGFVKQSGGHVRIYSEVGKGTTVRLYLPKADPATTAAPPAAHRTVAPQGDGEIILVVEDDPDVLNLVTILLTNMDYRVLRATDAASAVEIIERGVEPDLLFTDVVLRGSGSGVDLAREVAKRCPGVALVYMSGYTENSIIHQGVLDEGVLLISKPFAKAELARVMRTALEGRKTG